VSTGSEYARHWTLDRSVVFLNHGSFGACPSHLLAYQAELIARMEREPMRFFVMELPGLLEEALADLGRFIGADPAGLTFVNNASSAVSAVLRSLPFQSGDRLLVTDHAYPACRNALDFVAQRTGLEVVVAQVPFPSSGLDQVFDAVMEAWRPGTRLALLDHITSPTGLLFPIQRLTEALQDRGTDVLVDGAHAPGMIDLDLGRLGAAYYTGNCHKWMCTPKGAAFLHVRSDRLERIRPLTISHGATAPTDVSSRFRNEFDWTGTDDPSPWLTVPESIRYFRNLVPGGWPALRARNRKLQTQAVEAMTTTAGLTAPGPAEMLLNLAAFPLPDDPHADDKDAFGFSAIRRKLLEDYRIQVPVWTWPRVPGRVVRLSVQLYNDLSQYTYLAKAVQELLRDEG
jgi:isopenicillin-N epimerase